MTAKGQDIYSGVMLSDIHPRYHLCTTTKCGITSPPLLSCHFPPVHHCFCYAMSFHIAFILLSMDEALIDLRNKTNCKVHVRRCRPNVD